ncbi:hypothetical protein HUG17_10424 [Dermatophagoides farinae]|uniref:Uncharacterized protein n=1 Tax=Dermatophagoides farinae TaxID=6954 RepID=A0A9D4NQM1_DERFA|nr:hypothetical protein HUG17_10424 [Dermatophagoides farinae]
MYNCYWILLLIGTTILSLPNGYDTQASPFHAIMRETVNGIRNIQRNVQQKIQNRQRQPNGYELAQDISEAITEDIQQNHGRRSQKICEYLRQGQVYRGPCPADGSNNGYGDGGGVGGNYGDATNGAYLEEGGRPLSRQEAKLIRRQEKQRRKNERRERKRQRNREREGYGEPEIEYRNQPDSETKLIIRINPSRGGVNNNRPVNNNNNNGYQVRPEIIVRDEEEDYPRGGRGGGGGGGRAPSGFNDVGPKNERQNRDPSEMVPCRTNNGLDGLCAPAAYCYAQYSDPDDYQSNICQYVGTGANGICCPIEGDRVQRRYNNPIQLPQEQKPSMRVGFISLEDINTAAKEANKFIENYIQQERQLVSHVQFRLTVGGFINLVTTLVIKRKFKLSNEQARDGLYRYSIEHTDLEQYCIPEPSCQQGKYRTIDGSCNNLQRPLWGKSNTAFERLLPPQYNDGLNEPRTRSVTGDLLPSARLVSHSSAPSRNIPDPKYTLMLMQWGQFIDHDFTLASSTRAATGQGLICCHPESQRKVEHHACFPIEVPDQDSFYRRFNQKCMNLVRNAPAPRSGCSLGHREQMNTLTHVIDGSMVYGPTVERAKILRSFRGGRLKTSSFQNKEFLPFDRGNHSDDCAIPERDQSRFKCFLGGDARVNEQTGLTMIHALFVREHNRVAGELARLNPNWPDNTLYQEARRIVAAEIQHITYNEFLPIVLSPTVMKQFGLLPKTFDFTYNYDPKINPNVLNEFAAAAYRFHSLVQGTFRALDRNGQPTQVIRLHEVFNNPLTLYNANAFEQFLNGFVTDAGQTWDHFFADSLTNHLFEERGSGFGMDLVALNIQRGRDHGLPGYNQYRRLCGLQPANSFNDLNRFMTAGAAETFSQMYQNVEDIDLFIGGVHEDPLPDALVGPTFACIVAEQFRRSKFGDRFWYENGKLPHSFSKEQLMEIKKSSLASLICDNTDTIGRIQPIAFLRPESWNGKISCNQISRMNLSPWRNERIWS